MICIITFCKGHYLFMGAKINLMADKLWPMGHTLGSPGRYKSP